MFINCSNHRSSSWGEEQREAAAQYGEIVDYPFPVVSAELSGEDAFRIAKGVAADIIKMSPDAVMCQGESVSAFHIVGMLEKAGIPVFAATSERITNEIVNQDGSLEKTSVFNFVRFRRYGAHE